MPKLASLIGDYASFHDERAADLFLSTEGLASFDILCFQECLKGLPLGTNKESIVAYAQKAGFFYVARAKVPQFYSLEVVCGGTVILSRFPIVAQAEHQFSGVMFSDLDASLGVIHAKIRIREANIYVFTGHL